MFVIIHNLYIQANIVVIAIDYFFNNTFLFFVSNNYVFLLSTTCGNNQDNCFIKEMVV